MRPTFYLDKPNQSKPTRIMISIMYNYERIRIPSGEKIEPNKWSKTKQRAKESYIFASEINERLNKNQIVFEKAVKELIDQKLPIDKTTLINQVKLSNKKEQLPSKKKRPTAFFPFITNFISDCEHGINLINGKKYSIYTIKGYKVTLNHLIAFEKHSGKKITFNTIDQHFYNNFLNYFYNQKIYKGKDGNSNEIVMSGHTINSVGKHIKNLKVFVRQAIEKGINIHPDFLRSSFKVIAEDTDQVTLSLSELAKIEEADLPQHNLDHVRDCFLLACFTGLRFSDLKQLNQQNITSDEMLKVTTQKTGQKVVIPLHRTAKNILKKHDNIPPVPYSNQKMNSYLKTVCKLAGIDEMISVSKTRAGSKETTTLPKHDLVTVHTARRSFATNLYLAGMDIMSIKKMTGHHTEKSFLKYIRVSEEENAARAAKHSFFQ